MRIPDKQSSNPKFLCPRQAQFKFEVSRYLQFDNHKDSKELQIQGFSFRTTPMSSIDKEGSQISGLRFKGFTLSGFSLRPLTPQSDLKVRTLMFKGYSFRTTPLVLCREEGFQVT